jgi:hypothetical protein
LFRRAGDGIGLEPLGETVHEFGGGDSLGVNLLIDEERLPFDGQIGWGLVRATKLQRPLHQLAIVEVLLDGGKCATQLSLPIRHVIYIYIYMLSLSSLSSLSALSRESSRKRASFLAPKKCVHNKVREIG